MPSRTWRVKSTEVMSEILDGEAVIIDLASGRYHGAAGVGATVWQAISAGSSLDAIVAEVARLHTAVPADAADQIRGFIDQLVAAGLVVEDSKGQGPSVGQGPSDGHDPSEGQSPAAGQATTPGAEAAAPGATPWSTPALETHDDLQDLLLLDPVHEVTEAGWPHAAPPVS